MHSHFSSRISSGSMRRRKSQVDMRNVAIPFSVNAPFRKVFLMFIEIVKCPICRQTTWDHSAFISLCCFFFAIELVSSLSVASRNPQNHRHLNGSINSFKFQIFPLCIRLTQNLTKDSRQIANVCVVDLKYLFEGYGKNVQTWYIYIIAIDKCDNGWKHSGFLTEMPLDFSNWNQVKTFPNE